MQISRDWVSFARVSILLSIQLVCYSQYRYFDES